MPGLSYALCRAAAAEVRRAEHGRKATARLRGERVVAGMRSRPRLAGVLYVAGAQGRLVWRSPSCFALLEPPLLAPRPVGYSARARWLGRLERSWPFVRAYGPSLLVLAAMPLALLAGQYALLLIVLAGLFVILSVLVVLVLTFFQGLWSSRPREPAASSGSLLGRNWSIGLCHADDPDDVEPLVREAFDLATEFAAGTAYEGGILLCIDRGVTTSAARQAVIDAAGSTRVPGVDEAMTVVRPPGDRRLPESVVERPQRILGVFFSAVLALLALQTLTVVERERAACVGDSCDSRLTDHVGAFLWLLERTWPFSGWGGVTPASTVTQLYGILAPVLGLVTITLVGRGIWQHAKANRAAAAAGEQAMARAIDAAADAEFGGVFVNYRRGPHSGAVNAIRRELAKKFGENKVFIDHISISAGGRYPDELRGGLADSRVLLVMIHPTWLAQLLERRGTGEKDWVFDEIRDALKAGITVIPVYLDETDWLKVDELPEEISDLAHRQGRHVRYETNDLDGDLDALLTAVERAALSRMGEPRA